MNEDVLTVKQAAKLLGISQQAVYKRLDSTFQPYVEQRLNNQGKPQTFLKKSIIDDFREQNAPNKAQGNSTVEQPFNPKVEQPFNPVEQPLNTPEMASESVLIASLNERLSDRAEEIKRLVAQLEAKDKQIQAKDEQIAALQENLRAEQILHAKTLAQLEAHAGDPEEHPEDNAPQEAGFFAKFRAWWNSTAPQK